MSLMPYPEYKDSGVGWLGSIPGYWHTKRISWLFKTISSGTTPPNEKQEYYNGGVNWVTTGELRERGISETKRTVTSNAISTFSALRVYPPGTLLIAMYGATIGRLGFLEAPATTNQACCAFSGPIRTIPRYVFYVFLAAREHLLVIADGGGQPNINQDKLRSLRIPHPTYQEQKAIADYLDRETAEIDAFIADQELLIALLEERRDATITQAVTKGLSSDVPMIDSGVKWLNEIPAHWTWKKLKALAAQISKGTTPSTIGAEYVDSGVRFLRGEDIREFRLANESPRFISEATDSLLKRSQLAEGDILFVIAGTLGKTAVVTNEVLPANTNQAVAFIRLRDQSQVPFAAYWLRSQPVAEMTQLNAVVAAQPNLSMENLGKFIIPFPPSTEQEEIVAYLDREIAEIDATVDEAREAIALSKERRATVISAAVTGKIDVRETQDPTATNVEGVSVGVA